MEGGGGVGVWGCGGVGVWGIKIAVLATILDMQRYTVRTCKQENYHRSGNFCR